MIGIHTGTVVYAGKQKAPHGYLTEHILAIKVYVVIGSYLT